MDRRRFLTMSALSAAGVIAVGGVAWWLRNPSFESRVSHQNHAYRVVTLDMKLRPLSLFWKGADGHPLKTFAALEAHVKQRGEKLLFATNAGIFDPTFAPLGLHVELDKELRPVNLAAGSGNFFLKPNGVFSLRRGSARVEVSELYRAKRDTRLAFQSGPLLLAGQTPHPAIVADSSDRHVRSGIGVTPDGLVRIALSEAPVTFYELATCFRDALGCHDALHLDGDISQFHPGAANPAQQYGAFLAVTASL